MTTPTLVLIRVPSRSWARLHAALDHVGADYLVTIIRDPRGCPAEYVVFSTHAVTGWYCRGLDRREARQAITAWTFTRRAEDMITTPGFHRAASAIGVIQPADRFTADRPVLDIYGVPAGRHFR